MHTGPMYISFSSLVFIYTACEGPEALQQGCVVMAGAHVRNDDPFFAEYLNNSCAAVQHDEDDEAHSRMTKTARDFLKNKFGTISRFYSNITSADTADVNGFSRINTLRKALGALDSGGWERSYHQRIFHVGTDNHTLLFARPGQQSDSDYTNLCARVLLEFCGASSFQNRSTRIFRALVSTIAGDEYLAKYQPGNPVSLPHHRTPVLRSSRPQS